MKLLITADWNDADIVTAVTDITQEELNEIMPVINAIKNYTETSKKNKKREDNWPDPNRCEKTREEIYPELTEEQIEFFNYKYCPQAGADDCEIYVIESIELIKESEVLFNTDTGTT